MFVGGSDVFNGYFGQDVVMYFIVIVFFVFGMLMDVFVVLIGKGVILYKFKFLEVLCIGFIFGVVEMLILLIGWGLGILVSKFVLEWNYWIVFVLLIFLGGCMIIEGICGGSDEDEILLCCYSFWLLVMMVIVISFDVMVVGVGLVFLQVNIIVIVLVIGCVMFIMFIFGMMIGCFIGLMLGKCVEIFGGVVLIGIGVQIFWMYFYG